MGRDKSMLQYYDKPQRYHVYDMLLPFCERVFISCNAEQADSIEAGYDFITDAAAYTDIGPMAGLLTAFKRFPGKHLLVIGCDYPFLKTADLVQFSGHCKKDHPVCFYNEQEDIYEPLLSWYPNSSFTGLKTIFAEKKYSLRQFLQNNGALKFYPTNTYCMVSVDTQEAFIKAFNTINP